MTTTDGHYHNTENHHREPLLMVWEQVPLQNGETMAMPPPGQVEQQRNNNATGDDRKSERQGARGEKQREKGPRDVV